MKQQCPNCLRHIDVGIYVSGQRIRCPKCHVPFVVTRDSLVGPASTADAEHAHSMGPDGLASAASFEAQTTPSRPYTLARHDQPEPEVARADAQATGARRGPEAKQPTLDNAPEIPGYKVLSLLGQGAMGTVYLAERLRDGRRVAIKMLAEQLQENSEFVARFEREIAALGAVKHPCVVQLLEMSHVGEQRFFAMEFVAGTSMRTELAVTQPVPIRVVELLRAVTEGLGAAHSAGVIHRDLKPENVIVTPDGGVRIVDFGLAGLFGDGDPHPNLTRSRVTMGTVNYMAPEQRTDAKYVDQRADIYAVGVMLYEGLTGELPVGRFQLPSERGLGLPMLCDTVLNKALAREARARYQNCDELLVDLDKLAKLLKSVSLADTSPPRTRSTSHAKIQHIGRYRRSLRETVLRPVSRLWMVAAAVSLFIAVLGFALGWRWLSASDLYEICVSPAGASRCHDQATSQGPSLGLASDATVPIDTTLGLWTAEADQIVHQNLGPGAQRLQPTFARALLPEQAKSSLGVRLIMEPQSLSVQARQEVRAAGFEHELGLSTQHRVGLAFALGGRLVGAYLAGDGSCGYLDVEGGRIKLWEQMCGPLAIEGAGLKISYRDGRLEMQVDDLHLPPHPVDLAEKEWRPVLLCQNARCAFSTLFASEVRP